MTLYASTIFQDLPIAYYRLGEFSGSAAVDASGNGIDGTYGGGVSLGLAGAVASDNNPAAGFDGSTGYVDLGTASAFDFAGNAPFSVEAWVKPSVGTGDQYLVSHLVSLVGWEFLLESASPFLYLIHDFVGGNYISVQTAATVPLDAWSHVAVTYDGSSTQAGVKFYIDGVAAAVTSGSDALSGSIANAGGTALARRPGGSFYSGQLDEVAIYAAALSPSRIAAHYNAGVAVARALPVVTAGVGG